MVVSDIQGQRKNWFSQGIWPAKLSLKWRSFSGLGGRHTRSVNNFRLARLKPRQLHHRLVMCDPHPVGFSFGIPWFNEKHRHQTASLTGQFFCDPRDIDTNNFPKALGGKSWHFAMCPAAQKNVSFRFRLFALGHDVKAHRVDVAGNLQCSILTPKNWGANNSITGIHHQCFNQKKQNLISIRSPPLSLFHNRGKPPLTMVHSSDLCSASLHPTISSLVNRVSAAKIAVSKLFQIKGIQVSKAHVKMDVGFFCDQKSTQITFAPRNNEAKKPY